MDLGLRGRTALVCGSTAGLGRAAAEALAAEGARVVITGRRAELARTIAAGLPGAEAVAYDTTDPSAAEKLTRAARDVLGADLDIVVLNGPGPRAGMPTEIVTADLRSAMESLVIFQHAVVTQVLPGMRSRGWGRIVSIGSSGVLEPGPDLALSAVGRSALAAYLKMLATEVAADGVTVNMLVPGRMDTDRVRILDTEIGDRDGRDTAAVAAEMAAKVPIGRYGTADEFGAVAAFVCSEQARYMTGSAVRCDGGAARRL